MKSISYTFVIKKKLSCSRLRIIGKIKLSVSLINGDSLTFSLFLSLPCCCQCRFKRYIPKQTNSKTEETVPFWRQPAFPTTCLLSFLFSFDVASHKSHDLFFLSFFFTLTSFSSKITTKNVRDLTFLSFLLSFFYFVLSFSLFFFPFSFFKITTEMTEILLSLLYFLLSFFLPFFLSFFFFQFLSQPEVTTADSKPSFFSFFSPSMWQATNSMIRSFSFSL